MQNSRVLIYEADSDYRRQVTATMEFLEYQPVALEKLDDLAKYLDSNSAGFELVMVGGCGDEPPIDVLKRIRALDARA